MASRFIFTPDVLENGPLGSVGGGDGELFSDTADTFVETPAFGGRSGAKALFISSNFTGPRITLAGTPTNEVILHAAFYRSALPPGNNRMRVVFSNAANVPLAYLMIDASGFVHFQNAGGTTVAQTTAQAFFPGQWTLLEARVRTSGGTSQVELRNEAGTVLVNSNVSLATDNIVNIRFIAGDGGGDAFYISDIWVKDTSGTYNNSFGARRIYARKLIADAPGGGWQRQARRRIDVGILSTTQPAGNHGLRSPDTPGFEPGSGNYTFEGWFRWASLPGAGTSRTLMAKWQEASNQRTWRLRHYETAGDYRLAFERSTDGSNGTVVAVHDVVFRPKLNTWYHIAVSRSSGSNSLYIDGVRYGPPVSDSANYYNGIANVTIGGQSLDLADLSEKFVGWIDEVRHTVGAARYATEFTPATTRFPRDGSDPLWGSTQLLLGFDSAPALDESQYARTVFTNGSAAVELPGDGLASYQSIDRSLRDDTFIEAAFLPATGTITFTNNPADGETVTIGVLPNTDPPIVYTFRTTLTAAYDVLIGVDAEASMNNLRAAINQESGAGVIYGTGTVAHPDAEASDIAGVAIRISARVPGTGGNAITLATTVTGATLSGATLTGGVNIPAASEFSIAPPPSGVTAISAVALLTRRSLIGSGSATVQFSIRNAAGNLVSGADHVPPSNPAWKLDLFDSDSGGAAWSVSSMIGARTRNNRTS